MPPMPCLSPRCPYLGVHRGYCQRHRTSESERGYGREWRRVRAEVRGDACERCGSRSDLTLDHRVPQSLGGSNARANLRTLCRACHSAVGVRSNAGSFAS